MQRQHAQVIEGAEILCVVVKVTTRRYHQLLAHVTGEVYMVYPYLDTRKQTVSPFAGCKLDVSNWCVGLQIL